MTWFYPYAISALLMGVLIVMLEAFFGKHFFEKVEDLLDWILVFLLTPFI